MPSLTSTSTSGARSMFEYDLTASTSPEMRPTLASASASKSAVVIAAPRYSSTPGSATFGTAASTSSSQTVPSPAPAYIGANPKLASSSRSSRQRATSSSRSPRPSGSREGGEAARGSGVVQLVGEAGG